MYILSGNEIFVIGLYMYGGLGGLGNSFSS